MGYGNDLIAAILAIRCAPGDALGWRFRSANEFQASNKSKRLDALSLHVATYTVTLLVAAIILFGIAAAVIFAAINGALQFATDYITSRASSKLWEEQYWHRFFVVIGFDQLIHQGTLASTPWIMVTR